MPGPPPRLPTAGRPAGPRDDRRRPRAGHRARARVRGDRRGARRRPQRRCSRARRAPARRRCCARSPRAPASALELVEGNAELSPARLVGHHDPSRVLTEDYRPENFVPGPLVRALTSGALLYVEELNRVPEETLNVLLGVLSERRLHVPRLGIVDAAPTFRLVAAMNPSDAVGTGRITPGALRPVVPRRVRPPGRRRGDRDRAPRPRRRRRGLRRARGPAPRGPPATHPELRLGSSVRGALDLVAVAASLAELRDVGLAGRLRRRRGVHGHRRRPRRPDRARAAARGLDAHRRGGRRRAVGGERARRRAVGAGDGDAGKA